MTHPVKLAATMLIACAAVLPAIIKMREGRSAPEALAAVVAAPAPAKPQAAPPPSAGGNTALLYADARGHFSADIYVRGIPIRSLVDTGATLVSFSEEDAAKFGLRPEPSQRKAPFHTANGIVTASLVRIPEIRLQGITVHDVEAAIMPRGAMQGTLLGMSFMKKLASYESRGTSMVLRK
jgi:aspartyl protease family protein